jgi:hypothetical protein
MAMLHVEITPELREFIEKQHLFFVATAPLSPTGHVNLSPKGLDSFRVLTPTRVAYMDIISSGNETSAHLLENSRITFMFCSFEGDPKILRLYGHGKTVIPGTPDWEPLAKLFTILPSTRQIIVAEIDRVQTSCGYGVPLYEHKGERTYHQRWAETIGPDGLEAYKQEHSLVSIDGLPSEIKRAAESAKS